jgi:hypothetical protein
MPAPVDVLVDPQVFGGIFSEEMYSYFVYEEKGQEVPLGDIVLEADFVSLVTDAVGKEFSPFEMSISIKRWDGSDAGIPVETVTFDPDESRPQPFTFCIGKDDVPKLKEADAVELSFRFRARKVEEGDVVQIQNIWLKLTGGVSFHI